MGDVVPLRRAAEHERVRSRLFEGHERIADLIPGGEHIDHSIRFDDDVWDLRGHPDWPDKVGRFTKIAHSQVAPWYRSATKEWVLLQRNPALAAQRAPTNQFALGWDQVQEPIKLTTAQGNLKSLAAVLAVVDAQSLDFAEPETWDRLELLMQKPASVDEKREEGATLAKTTLYNRAQQVVAFWQVTLIGQQTHLLGEHPPFDDQPIKSLFGEVKKYGNSVQPHEAVGHALGFVAWFFDNIAEDIVDHIEWWTDNTAAQPALSGDELNEEMLALLSKIAAENDGKVPAPSPRRGHKGPAAAALARLLGNYDADEAYLAGRWAMRYIQPTPVPTVGITPCPIPIKELPTNDGGLEPWTDSLLPSMHELDQWQRRLVYYAMYYLSATVMLRDSQLATLPLDPVTTKPITRPNGVVFDQHKLRVFRTKNRHTPTPTKVVVNARIVRIVDLLRRLQLILGYDPSIHPDTGLQTLLDQRLAVAVGMSPHALARKGIYLDTTFFAHIQDGATDLHERGLIARDLKGLKVNMRQMRITCAQAYAIREHGHALSAAFGQWDSRAVAEGYIGAVFRIITPADPDETCDLAREDVGRRISDIARDDSQLTGKGLRRAKETVERNRLPVANPAPLTPARMKTLGKNNPNVEQGPLTLCFFQAEGAMCGGKGKPDFRLCLPGQCRNSVMTQLDRARYELMRRQHLARKSPALARAAAKMNDLNPEIAFEFENHSDDDLAALIKVHVDEYIQRALDGN